MAEIKHRKLRNLFRIMSIIGPGIIAVNAGNDAGGIATYSTIGADYGYAMLWGLVIITISLSVVQEMNARMAVVTGKGLADLIREKFGVKWTFFAMLVLLVANFGLVMGDFAGIAMSMELFHIPKLIAIPVFAVLIWVLVTKGSYNKVEKIFLIFTVAFFGYIISAFEVHPDWGNVFSSIAKPTLKFNTGFLLTFIGLIGTTITPYMQFYLQSSIVDKHIALSDYKYEKLDVYFGSVWGNAIAFFIIVSTAATLYVNHISISTAADAAQALGPIAGRYATVLFGVGLLGASLLACAIIPLSTSYAVCEAFGFESGVDNDIKEAPVFFGIYTVMIAISTVVILLPGINLVKIAVVTQQIAGILSPAILIFMIILVNDKRIMGKYVNTKLQNVLSFATVGFIIVLSAILFISPLLGL
jgi:NRAMP (natural resistance-associated macrophage protein)-like metal ion transporter